MPLQVKVIDKSEAFVQVEKQNLKTAQDMLADSILSGAILLAPELTGALKSSGRVKRTSETTIEVSFGGDRVPYAKRRHYENKKNPQTLRYLERAGDAGVKRGLEPFL